MSAVICLLSLTPCQVNAAPTPISRDIPSIKIHHPISDFNFINLTALLKSAGCFFPSVSASFSIQSPKNTTMPPMLAISGSAKDKDLQSEKTDPSETAISIVAMIPFAILLILQIAFAIRIRPGRRG
jgi:hypothetical protein